MSGLAGGIVSNCFFCGSAGRAGATCQACLVPIPRLDPDSGASYACPRCAVPLLAIGIAPSATIHACTGCHGLFLRARAWCTLVARPELARAIASRLPVRAAPPAELVRLLRCPACSREMERGRFGASSNVVIDVCTAHGSWLDSGEIVAVADHAALRARVGADAARRATEAAERPHGHEALRVDAAEAEAAMRRAASAARTKNVKRGGLIVVLAFVAVRIAYMMTARSAVPTEIPAAGQSAASADRALRPQ